MRDMNKLMYFIAAAAVLLAVGCKKEKVDPAAPTIAWDSNSGFAQVELVDGLDAVVTATAPGKFLEFKLVLGLGNYNILANPYIQLSSNKGGSSNPVMDLIADASCVSFAKGLGMSVGQTLQDRTEVKLDLKAILEKILQGQVIENNTMFTIDIRVMDQNGKVANKSAKFHFTSAPTITWQKNAVFSVVDLDAPETDCKVAVWAPGLIENMTVTLGEVAAPFLQTYVKNRTTEGQNAAGQVKIDLINDPKVAESFKGWFPAGDAVKGKDKVTLDFGFMYNLKYDLEASTNVFTVVVEDKNGKMAYQQVMFKKN